jgi:outer membrane protein TolC
MLVLVALAGCTSAYPGAPCSNAILPTRGRGVVQPDLAALPPAPAVAQSLDRTNALYHELTEQECQCRAAQAGISAQLLAMERKHGSKQALLEAAASEARNREVADALETFFHLVEAEGRADLLARSLSEAAEVVAKAQEMKSKGLRPPPNLPELERQLSQVRGDSLTARLAIERLNSRLRTQLGLDDDIPLWPVASLQVDPAVPPVAAAVQFGLENRPDLALLDTLSQGGHTLAMAQQVLGAVNPFLNEQSPVPFATSLLACVSGGKARVREQLQALREQRQRQAIEEIRLAVRSMALHLQLIEEMRQRTAGDQRRVQELEEKKGKGLGVEGDLSAARLQFYKSQGELLHEVTEWEIARVQLGRAQGLYKSGCPASAGLPACAPAKGPAPSSDTPGAPD